MSVKERRGAKTGARILRHLYVRPWVSVNDLAAHLEIHEDSARNWVKSLDAEGMLKSRKSERKRCGPAAQEYALESPSKWGGL